MADKGDTSDRTSAIDDAFDMDVGGHSVTVQRGDLSDKAWQEAKDAAEQRSADSSGEKQDDRKPADILMAEAPKPQDAPAPAAPPPVVVLPPDNLPNPSGNTLSPNDLPPPVAPGATFSLPPTGGPVAGDPRAPALAPLTAKAPPGMYAAPAAAPMPSSSTPGTEPAVSPDQQAAAPIPSSEDITSTKPPESKVPGVPDRSKELFKMAENQKAAIQAEADVKSTGMQEEAKLYAERQQLMVEAEAKRAAAQQRMQQDVAARQAAYDKTINEMNTPARVDPDRFWNSRNTLQKILFVIANGLTKGAMMQHMQAAINADIDAQKSEIESNSRRLNSRANLQYNAIAAARQNGLDEFEAVKAGQMFNLDLIQNHIQQVAANTNSQLVKTNAAQMMGQVDQMRLKTQMELEQSRNANALQRESANQRLQLEYARLGLDAQKQAAEQRAMAAKGAGGGRPLESTQVQRIADLQASLDTAGRYSKEFKDKAAGLISKVATAGPDPLGLNPSQGAKYNAKLEAATQLIGKAIEGGKMTDADLERYKRMIPQAGDPKGEIKWDALIREIQSRLDIELNTAKKAGYNTSEFEKQTPAKMDDSEAIRRLRIK